MTISTGAIDRLWQALVCRFSVLVRRRYAKLCRLVGHVDAGKCPSPELWIVVRKCGLWSRENHFFASTPAASRVSRWRLATDRDVFLIVRFLPASKFNAGGESDG